MITPIYDDNSAISALIGKEGYRYSDRPEDAGGPTKYGITLRTLSIYRGGTVTPEDVKNLSVEEAKAIYKKFFWDKYKLGEFKLSTAYFLFDCFVQHGEIPIKWLQKIVDTKQDGIIGPLTIAAVNKLSPLHVILPLAVKRNFYYETLKNYQVFAKGWKTRLFEVTIESTLSATSGH